MKLGIIGFWAHDHCEFYFSKALEELGVDVIPFKLSKYFKGTLGGFENAIPLPLRAMNKLNADLIEEFNSEDVDNLFFWNCNHIFPSTMKKLKKMGKKISIYNNDDPYGSVIKDGKPFLQLFQYHWFMKSLKYADYNFVYRPINVDESKAYVLKDCKINILQPYFIPELHKPSMKKAKDCRYDVIFIGHYENDGRLEILDHLHTSGIRIALFGTGWNELKNSKLLGQKERIIPLRGDDYAKTLGDSKICLSFLSSMNRDVYTRRCFEIPGMRKLLLCQKTKEMMELFTDNEEATFFSNKNELVTKIKFLLDNLDEIDRISNSGYERSIQSGYDIKSRAESFLKIIQDG